MPVGGESVLAGQYLATLNSVTLGIHEGDAGVPAIEQRTEAELIQSSDAYGSMIIDGFWRGGNFTYQGVLQEWRSGSKSALWPYASTWGQHGVIARRLYDLAQPLVLTAVTGTPAQVAGDPNTLTASRAILMPGFSQKILFGPTLRKIPLQMLLLPFLSGGNVVSFTLT